MGRSHAIQKMLKESKEFMAYMQELQANMKPQAQKYGEELDAAIEKFYAGDTTTVHIAGISRDDFQSANEFSLKSISDVVQRISDRIFVGKKDSGGSEGKGGEDEEKDEDADEETKKVVEALAKYEDMAASVAVDCVCNVLSSVALSRSSTYQHSIQRVAVGPGLVLHLLVVGSTFEDKGFFSQTHIMQSFIEYRLIFSRKVAAAQTDIMFIADKVAEYTTSSESYKRLHKEYVAMIASKDYLKEKPTGELHEMAASYKSVLQELSEMRSDALSEIQKLCGVKGALKAAPSNAAPSLLEPGMIDTGAIEEANAPLLRYLEGKRV